MANAPDPGLAIGRDWRARTRRNLLRAARAFIDHAMAIEAPDVTSAFTLLALKPYPLA
jgi:hypothetical protein